MAVVSGECYPAVGESFPQAHLQRRAIPYSVKTLLQTRYQQVIASRGPSHARTLQGRRCFRDCSIRKYDPSMAANDLAGARCGNRRTRQKTDPCCDRIRHDSPLPNNLTLPGLASVAMAITITETGNVERNLRQRYPKAAGATAVGLYTWSTARRTRLAETWIR